MFGSNSKDYTIKSVLANCCYGLGSVYLAQHNITREYVSLKRFKMDKVKEEGSLICVSK